MINDNHGGRLRNGESRASNLQAPPSSTGRALNAIGTKDSDAWKTLDHEPFLFRHNLADHPLFEIPRLAKLAAAVLRRGDRLKYAMSAGSQEIGACADEEIANRILSIEEANTWLKISSLQELDPAYDKLLRSVIDEVELLSGLPLWPAISWLGLTVFIASPKVVTPYHFDHETNFLFQIRGEKEVCLFDPNDRFVLSEEEIEDFYRGNPKAGIFKDGMRDRAQVHRLRPGLAIHHPPLAPHIVNNGNAASISVSIFYTLSASDVRARVYQANYCLRRLGFRPVAPGTSATRDRMKSFALKAVSKAKPRSQQELLFSGIERITRPFQLGRRLVRKLAPEDATS